MARRSNEKLAAKYYGPFEILEKIGAVAYKLQLPPSASIHPVFHVLQLRKAIGTNESLSTLPKALTEDMTILLVPEKLEESERVTMVGRRLRLLGRGFPSMNQLGNHSRSYNYSFRNSTLRTRFLVRR